MIRLHVDKKTKAIRGFTSYPVNPGAPFVTHEAIEKDLLKRGVLYYEDGKIVIREAQSFAKSISSSSVLQSGGHANGKHRISPQQFINALLRFDGTVDAFVAMHRCRDGQCLAVGKEPAYEC